MNLFKTFTLKWWQAGIFKVGPLALGLAVGAHWPNLFAGFLGPPISIAIACLLYTVGIWSKQ